MFCKKLREKNKVMCKMYVLTEKYLSLKDTVDTSNIYSYKKIKKCYTSSFKVLLSSIIEKNNKKKVFKDSAYFKNKRNLKHYYNIFSDTFFNEKILENFNTNATKSTNNTFNRNPNNRILNVVNKTKNISADNIIEYYFDVFYMEHKKTKLNQRGTNYNESKYFLKYFILTKNIFNLKQWVRKHLKYTDIFAYSEILRI